MDFYRIKERSLRNGITEIYPDFQVGRITDLMVRGKSFYAVWDAERSIWSTDEYDVQRLVDDDLRAYWKAKGDEGAIVKWMGDFSSNSWLQFRNYMSHISDSLVQLDDNLTFADQKVKKTDYASRRLPYSLQRGDISAYDELISTLYDPRERDKLEWAIGAVVSGEAKNIQKFLVLYGAAGTGKSTVLNIVEALFPGYCTNFEAKALAGNNNTFATDVFRNNPLVAIQQDGDLSRIEDNTKLNSLISHENMTMNEKNKPSYSARSNAFLFMGTNKPVKITDAKSGIIRRLIDVKPSGRKLDIGKYQALTGQVQFELGAIAYHCLSRYRKLGKNYYNTYRPVEMILQTDVFFNYIEANYDLFRVQDGVTLSQAYELYKQYCDESMVDFKLPRHKFREELKNYFKDFHERYELDGKVVRSYYGGFITDQFKITRGEETAPSLSLESRKSLLDDILKDCPAQYATVEGIPEKRWADVTTTLKDIDTTRVHYVKVPDNHIVIDFDLKDEDGNKSAERNLEAASEWPTTYAEYSKGGAGIHLHYTYTGSDLEELSAVYSEGIEIKRFRGNASLRRRVSLCNTTPVAELNSGLPLKEKKVINFDKVKSEKGVRDLIVRNLNKEIHPGTKPSIDFIYKILEDAYNSGISYDVTDMRGRIMAFANNSTHQAPYCLSVVTKMKFQSEVKDDTPPAEQPDSDELVFFDCEVFPNLLLVNWKIEGPNHQVVRMINPKPHEIEALFRMKLVGFNCRKYDNHILYGAYLGETNEQIYQRSQRIVNKQPDAFFREAYNISYTDVYDYASEKMSLKKWEIKLGLHHQELGLPWDKPVPPERWKEVAEYCDNDVISTEAVHNARQGDWTARKILADLAGMSVNTPTNTLAIKFIFGNDQNPELVYTDLSKEFPGYEYVQFGADGHRHNMYRGIDVGFGGYVYAKPGMYENVGLLDAASLHPNSIVQLNYFGKYTPHYKDILDTRIAIKHKDFDRARKMFGGKLAPYLEDTTKAKQLSQALKIVLNSCYGLTSATFPNPMRDERNVNNIVAIRGALTMVDLKFACEAKGWTVVHIKTDSIKLANITDEMIKFVQEFGKKYGYTFEHEATYKKMCLVNDAVYIAKYALKDGVPCYDWTATGAQFQHPYVFKTLFSHEDLVFDDLCETKTVTTALYVDMNEGMPEGEHDYHFVGRAGQFCPIKDGSGGGVLLREKKDSPGVYSAPSGTKGFRWLESEIVRELGKEDDIDMSYFEKLANAAIANISNYGSFEQFVWQAMPPLRALDQLEDV